MSTGSKQKIALFVCNDLMGLLLLNRVVPAMIEIGYEPVIFNTGTNRNRNFKIPTPPVVAFYNSTLLSQAVLPTLEAHPIDTAFNHSFKQLAKKYKIHYREITNVNDPAFIEEIAFDSELRGGVALRFLQVFEREAINVFHEKGFMWNLHSGLLPKYKGLLTPFRAIANEEKTYGMTLHDLACGIDKGDIIMKGELPLNPAKPVLDLYLDTLPIGVDMVLKSLKLFKVNGCVPRMPQENVTCQSYYTNPTELEFESFAKKGIVYARPVQSIMRLSSLFAGAQNELYKNLEQKMSDVMWAFEKEKKANDSSLLFAGAGDEIRTRDPYLGKVMLYP